MSNYFKVLALTVLGFFSSAASVEGQKKLVLSASNVLIMDSEFTQESVAKVMVDARVLNTQLGKGKPLYLVITSPGGSIDAGIELIDNLQALGRPVHTVNLFSASMAFQTAQGLGERYVTPNGTLMSHKAKGQFSGEFPGQLDSRFNYYMRRITRLDQRTVDRSGGKLTLESYRAMYANEMWCDGQDCVDKGVADAVATVSCDSTLEGTKETTVKGSFMGIPVEANVVKAACPTITGPLEVKIKLNGKSITNLNDLEEIYQAVDVSYHDAQSVQKYLQDQVASYAFDKNHVEKY